MGRLGLIAGGGGLPGAIAADCMTRGREVFVVRLKGLADPSLTAFPGAVAGVAELGRSLKALRDAECARVCFAGVVHRPDDFSTLKPDLTGLKYMPGLIAAAAQGDDALLRAILRVFEREGLAIEGVGEAGAGLRLAPGPLGSLAPAASDQADIAAAVAAAHEVGRTDIAQGAIARGGEVVAREGQDGTDAMLARVARAAGPPQGVLAKLPKPGQDRRVDLPTIGVRTIERVAAAGLKGLVGEAAGLLMVDPDAVREAADRLGVFVLGLEAP